MAAAVALLAATANSADGRDMTTKELLFACTSAASSNDYPVCLVFMTGFQAGVRATLAKEPWCAPSNTTFQDAILAFVQQMKNHPQLLELPVWQAVGAAMVTAYPCGSQTDKTTSKIVDGILALTDFKIRPGNLTYASMMQIDFVGRISNKANMRVKAKLCVRLYDANGFEIEKGSGGEVNLGLGQSDASNGNVKIESRLWSQVTSIKAYAAKFGCADSPGEALSQIVEIKPR